MPLVHIHIPKTGGTAFNAAHGLRFVGADQLGIGYDGEGWESHVAPGTASHWPGSAVRYAGDCETVVILRDPVDRVLSMYAYIRQHHMGDPVHPGAPAASGPLVDFCAGYWRAQNGMVRQLARGLSCRDDMTRDDLEEALGVLRQVDHVLFTDGLAVPRLNASAGRRRADSLSPEELVAIRGANELDAVLYESAKAGL